MEPQIQTAATDLVKARNALTEADKSHHRLDAPHLRTALVELHDFWLTAKGHELGIKEHSGFALVAVGGLGRKELLPFSDLDLILLHDGVDDATLSRVADGLWYPLWDAHIGLDHSVRTVPQALQVAAADMSAALGMLEARHICGDEALSTLLITGVRTQWRNDIRSRLPELVDACHDRWRFAGDIAHRAEPDLKNGKGGLRDVQVLRALALGQLTDSVSLRVKGSEPLSTVYTRLLDMRTELHRVAGRNRETVRAQDADEIAAALRLGDRFDLSRSVSDCSRTVSYAMSVGLRTAANLAPRKGLSRLRRPPVRRPLDEGVVAHYGEVALARNAVPSKDPGLILRVAAASAITGMPMSVATLDRLADYAPELREPWPAEALNDLLVLLGTGPKMLAPIEALDRTGLWGRLLPEWGAVRDLPPRDAIHTWTVDRHLVETASYAAALTTQVSRPDLLLLGALIHDIGKGRSGDHSVVGADLAIQIGRRLGLWPQDVDLLSEMVRHHLLLPVVATRRDLDDPATIESVVTTLDGSRELLELLGALAEADSRATGPGVWNDWKSQLVATLVRRCAEVMTGAQLTVPEPLTADLIALGEAQTVQVKLENTDNPHTYHVVMVAPDSPGVLAKMAGVLALASLSVHSAVVRSHDGMAINTFEVLPEFGTPPAPELLRQQLISALDGTLDILPRLAKKEAERSTPATADSPALPVLATPAKPRLIWVRHGENTILEVRAADQLGLLTRICALLADHRLSIRWAKVSTLGASVIDTLCLPLLDADTTATLEAAILPLVPEPALPDPEEGPSGKEGVPMS